MGWLEIKYDNKAGVAGDSVWDIMDTALDEIVKEYRKEWDRNPTVEELKSILEFCMGGLELTKS